MNIDKSFPMLAPVDAEAKLQDKRWIAAGFEQQEVVALIKILRSK